MNEAQFNEVSEKLNKLDETLSGLGDVIATALKPVTDAMVEITNQSKATEEAEKAALVAKVVEAELLTEAVANTLDMAALKELSAKATPKPGSSATLNHRFNPEGDTSKVFQLPKAKTEG